MAERLLRMVTLGGPSVPSRVCSLLAQRSVEFSSIQMTRETSMSGWVIQVVVHVKDEPELHLLITRLNRLVDVVNVIEVDAQEHYARQSAFVRLSRIPSDLTDLVGIASAYSAEILEVMSTTAVLHLAASPAVCAEFLSALEPYSVVEVVRGATGGISPTGDQESMLASSTPFHAGSKAGVAQGDGRHAG